MQRRRFVGLVSGGLAILASPFVYRYLNPVVKSGWLKPCCLTLIWDQVLITSVGQKYLAKHETEASERELAHRLSALPEDEVMQEQAIRTEFREEKTVVVDGWLLSISEARQCALASLVNS
jgi:hypothetical protein